MLKHEFGKIRTTQGLSNFNTIFALAVIDFTVLLLFSELREEERRVETVVWSRGVGEDDEKGEQETVGETTENPKTVISLRGMVGM